jgi:hypothetical protein
VRDARRDGPSDCDWLPNTFRDETNALTGWYGGWYMGLARKPFLDYTKNRAVGHQAVERGRLHSGKRITIAVVFRMNGYARDRSVSGEELS